MVQKTTFIQKLHRILEDEAHRLLICWSTSGTSFLVLNSTEFSKQILPKVFKHNNYTSFVRQLNLYGFHKKNRSYHRHNGNTSDKDRDNEPREFEHPLFLRNRPDLLGEIRRKSSVPDQQPDGVQQNHPVKNDTNGYNGTPPHSSCHHGACSHRCGDHNGNKSPLVDGRIESPHSGSSFPSTNSPHSRANSIHSSSSSSSLPIVPDSIHAITDQDLGRYNNSSNSYRPPQFQRPQLPSHQDFRSPDLVVTGNPSNVNDFETTTMMKHISRLQNNVLELVAELREVRKKVEWQQNVIDELTGMLRSQNGHQQAPSSSMNASQLQSQQQQQQDSFSRSLSISKGLSLPNPGSGSVVTSSAPTLPPPSILASFSPLPGPSGEDTSGRDRYMLPAPRNGIWRNGNGWS